VIGSKSVNIYLNSELLNINDYLERDIIKKEEIIDNKKAFIDFYIWNEKIKLKSDRQKHILFLDENSVLKAILPSGKDKLAFNGISRDHSIVVKSKYFNDLDYIDDSNSLFSDENIKLLKKVITLELEKILIEIYAKNIDTISDEYIKFLKVEQDEITQNVYHSIMLPFTAKIGKKRVSNDLKEMISKLIDILIKEAPDSFINNLTTILNLSPEDSKKIEYVEKNYSIIKAITEKEKIIKRIDFLNHFDELVNGENRKKVKERSELHKIVEKNLWLIDKEFEDIKLNEIASDESIKTILQNKDFYQFDSTELEDIFNDNNLDLKKIPDIFIPITKNNTIYIIELKKPNVKINDDILFEIKKKYVKTIKNINKKYTDNSKKIHAIAISDEKTEDVYEIGSKEKEVFLEPKCWSELIENARDRCNEEIIELENKLKNSKWKDLDEFISTHQ